MGRRRHRLGALRMLLAVLAALAFAGATFTLVVVDESRDLRVTLCAVIAAAAAVTTLVSAPAVRPLPALSGRRRPGTAWFGRLLVRTCWLLRVAVNGAAAGWVAWNADSGALQPGAAALVALSLVLVTVGQLGQYLAGFVTAIDDLRGSGLVRRAGTVTVAAVTAGVSGYLSVVVERFRTLVTDPVWELLREEWGLPSFLAGLVVALVTLLVVTVVACVVGVLMLSLAFAVGPHTVLGRGLMRYSPVRYTRWVDSAYVSVVGLSASFPVARDERTTRLIYEGVRRTTGPLDPVFLQMLADDVARAHAALVPPDEQGTSIVLRAVGDHDEILLDGGRGARPVDDFPEAAALRRIRLALHSPESGLPSEVRCSMRDDGWDGPGWSTSVAEPAWLTVPGHDDLAREVVRYPPGAPWVRERLDLPAVGLDW